MYDGDPPSGNGHALTPAQREQADEIVSAVLLDCAGDMSEAKLADATTNGGMPLTRLACSTNRLAPHDHFRRSDFAVWFLGFGEHTYIEPATRNALPEGGAVSFVRGAELHLLTAHRTRGSYRIKVHGSFPLRAGLASTLLTRRG